jgi:hypothetical protein
MPTVGTPAGPARHRPSPALSPRRQACIDTTNQFPAAETGENPRAPPPRPCQIDVTGLPRARSARVTFPHTPTLSCATDHARLHGTKRPSRRYHCPALRCTTASPPSAVFPVTCLNQTRYRVKWPATDTTCLSPRTGAQCRPQTPPTAPNRIRCNPP